MFPSTEILIIFLLILANGIFAMSEIALVSVRKSHLQKLLDKGDKRAATALELANSPNRLLSTVQFGITLVGVFAGAFGGATIAAQLANGLVNVPYIGVYRQEISITLVVLAITFLSIIFGELVPKRLALHYPDQISLFMAKPMDLLSRLGSPLVRFLSASTDIVLNLFGIRLSKKEAAVSEDELKILMEQGLRAGVLEKAEKEMVEGVLNLDQLKVGQLMTPRGSIIWLSIRDSDEANWRKVVASGHSYFPVYDTSRDNVLGIVSVKALWANLSLANKADLKSVLMEPLFVPTSISAIKLLESFKQTGLHIALVSDEFGGVEGLVTLQDVLEAIVGEMPSKDQPKRYQARLRKDGTWLIDAMLDIDEFKAKLNFKTLPGEVQDEYQTVGGFILNHFGRIPIEGDAFEFGGFHFEVLDMDKHRIDKILATPVKKEIKEHDQTNL
ncbi:MAG: hemolysin family protein [bacterium]